MRVVQTHISNHLGGYEDEYYAYTFTGKVKQRQHVHSATGKTTQTEVYTYSYDHAERLLSVTHKLNAAAAVTLEQITYDEAGRLKTKKIHGSTETSTYEYNVRNWLTQITGNKFNQTLTYNVAVNGVTPQTPTYNGDVSAMKWKSGTETAERGYKFTYDGLNRMTNAAYGEGTSLTANPNRYDEVPTYDKMGNLKTLQRKGMQDSGFGLIDNLTATYSGNSLIKVSDAVSGPLYNGAFHFMDGANEATEYVYDANGNLKKDYNKKIVDIRYNYLNLPDGLQFTNGNTTRYVYDAAGAKLSVTYETAVAGITIPMTNVMTPLAPANILTTTKTDYCGNVIYENGALSRILTEEGYITLSESTPTYHYYLRDHEGNNRVVLNQSGTVEQVNHYYPFGGLMRESTAGGVQPYKYNGKELDRMHGLDLFDYWARHYDAALGRWVVVDPLAEKKPSISSYTFCSNNPINRIDLDGNWDLSIHLARDRSQNGYGIAIVTDRNGNEIYRFKVRAEGTGGRNRMNINADTPLGMYDIPNKNPWLIGGSRKSYGPNARLNMIPESGEIERSGRDAIRIHGGRQERYDSKTYKWTPINNPELKKTQGCLRAFDADMATFKDITDNLQKNDAKEIPGKVNIKDDLDKFEAQTKVEESIKEEKIKYFVPEF